MTKPVRLIICLLLSLLFSGVTAGEDMVPSYKFPGDSSYMRDWLVCGPFPNAAGIVPIDFKHDRRCNGYFTDYLTAIGGEAGADPHYGQSFREAESSQQYVWERVMSEDDLISFEKILKPNDLVVGYAFCHVMAEQETPAILSVGSNDGIRVFLNGVLVHDHHISRWLGKDTDYVPVTLKTGANRLLIKVDEGSGDWGFSARLLEYRTTLDSIEKNIDRYRTLTVVTLDDDIVATFGQPYQIATLHPGVLASIEVRDASNTLKALLSGPPGMELRFPSNGFGDGALVFRAFFPLLDGRVISAERQYFKGKLPRHAPARMLGPGLEMQRDGKPFLPIGCYGARPEDYPLLKEVGFNFVTASVDGLDQVQAAGLMAAVPFHGDDEAYLKDLEEKVNAYKNHPAVLCWMLADEPEYNKLDIMVIHRAYQKVHEIDPLHPTYLVITDPRGHETFGRCCDVLAIDTYPVSRGVIQSVGVNIAKAYQASDGDQPIWHCGQTFRWPSDRAPTPQEHRYMSYLALLEGAKGLLWYAHRWGNYHLPSDDPALWEAQKQFVSEARRLEPFILAEGLGQRLSVDNQQGMVRAVAKTGPDGKRMVIAVNSSSEESARARIHLEGVQGTQLAVLGEDRAVPIKDEMVEDTFEPLGVHVFVTE